MSTVVLIGGGHTHLHVLRALARQPRVLERWVLVTAEPHATYSGMLPGVLAGAYDRDAMHIALPPLCSAAGVELVIGE